MGQFCKNKIPNHQSNFQPKKSLNMGQFFWLIIPNFYANQQIVIIGMNFLA